ncbi:hypothetical protein CANTEDRAFT_131639 [Yamadazyma tenuis ATCC 10573]|uniref:Phosphodiesterase n=1 Tax=Candida tenuis (strain ATCC 10573 / BCRC 21748 / CBS 615 / JCM 9827 / NBRC 10315 / NRRL Y-1498 / VKM Y-70) TaxID=590646 RepID=G3B7F6_CANTC|nr:uncharacterized protein CANTEDRAFT_131639 [Yamadazyma tenuis ATCC 10573]EGV62264.1 hypothetical protein CANTEDRAFT_131639 [Yamadazyma tenuis ATCC 10573]
MAEVIANTSRRLPLLDGIAASSLSGTTVTHVTYEASFQKVVEMLFRKGNSESDTDCLTLVVIEQPTVSSSSRLDSLSFDDKLLLLKYYFSHLNVVALEARDITNETALKIKKWIGQINTLIHDRISRIQTWTGTAAIRINDSYTDDKQIGEIISTMSSVLTCAVSTSPVTIQRITGIKDAIIHDIDFLSLLSQNSTSHLSKLCNLVGHWSFPAHELSNDDLVYCVYLIIKYCLVQLEHESSATHAKIALGRNELLGLIFMVRDSYKNGNPFHNFRHAVDVLQACFHYVIRLGYLSPFTQFQSDPKADELICLKAEKFGNAVELISMKAATRVPPTSSAAETPDTEDTSLNLVSTLALLVAALGHDVGHPGVTNQFLVKHSSPTSLVFNERSVLESFHTSVFLNKILVVNWPQFLQLKIDTNLKLIVKELIITCILATDMAEHFDYIDKLNKFNDIHHHHHHHQGTYSTTDSTSSASSRTIANSFDIQNRTNQVKLISSLLIKCADISNVTRPLRVSAQWASVLSREFDEVSKVEEKITDSGKQFSIKYDKVPMFLVDILQANPTIHKGQMFFINTFAENLFNNISELLPPLKFTGEIVQENKDYWLKRDSNRNK